MKMFKRKLFKRALPIILSVAMVFQSTPATALAAEASAQESAADSESPGENTDSETSVGDTSDDSAPGDNASDDDHSDERSSSEDDSNESNAGEDTSGESGQDEASVSTGETKQDTADESVKDNEEQQDSETASEEKTYNEEGVKTAAIVIDENDLKGTAEELGMAYDEETGTVFTTYKADRNNPFGEIFAQTANYLKVELGGEENADLRKQLTYTWKNADGTSLAEGTAVPKAKGSYRLEIKLDKIDNLCGEASAEMNFRIDPRDIIVDYEDISIMPGTTAEKAVEAIKEGYKLKFADLDEEEGTGDDLSKDVYIAACDISIIRERKEDGTKDGNSLAAADLIKSSEEYSVKLSITLTDQENYTVSNTVSVLRVEEGLETQIKANTVKADGTSLGWTYNNNPPAMADFIKEMNPYVVEAGAVDGEEKIVAGAKLQYQWFDANGNALEEKAGDGTSVPDKVKNAGTYRLHITYAGETGLYNASETIVDVVIGVADVYIGDIKTGTESYMEGTTVAKALQTITGYGVYQTGVEEKKDLRGNDLYFWGVSYPGDADKNTQPYELVFAVRRGQHVTDAEGKDTVVWEADTLGGDERLKKTGKVSGKDVTYEYRFEFSGKKAVYGEGNSSVDVNDSQENYRVDLTAETIAANALGITLAEEGPVIDVTPMLTGKTASEENKGSLTNPIIKTYDGKPFFATKDEYKKALVPNKTNVKSTDLTYQWQVITGYDEVENEDGSTDIEVGSSDNVSYQNVEFTSAPTAAGCYRLAVSYKDKETGAVSETKYVYYTIQKEDIIIKPSSTVPAYYNETVSSYLSDVRAALRARAQSTGDSAESTALIDYTVEDFTAGEDGRELAKATRLKNSLKDYERNNDIASGCIGALTWSVERKITEGDKKDTWYELGSGDTFVEGGEYRLTVRADWQNANDSSLRNYNNRYALDFKNEQILDEATGTYKTQERYGDQQSVVVTPVKTQGIQVEFGVDWDKIAQVTKTYDGMTFDSAVMTAVKGAVTAVNSKTGEAIDPADISFGWYWDEKTSYLNEDKAIHAGTYYLMLSVEKGEKYLGQRAVFRDKSFVITPAELTVTPVRKDGIKAGTYIASVDDEEDWAYNNAENVKKIIKSIDISGSIPDADKAYITDKVSYYANSDISYPWFMYDESGPVLHVTDKTTGQPKSGYLRGDRAYNVKFSFDGTLRDYWETNTTTGEEECKLYGSDYTLKFATISFTAERASSDVSSYNIGEYDSVTIRDSVTPKDNTFEHTITPREGIPYIYGPYNKEEKYLGGNYLVVRITAPAEYADVQGAEDKVIYRNSIESAGGYVCDTGCYPDNEDSETHRRYIIAVFDAAEIAEEGGKPFEITWEEGFTETFVIEVPKSLLMEDLTRAVLPKSIAFNSASAKMAVGDGQQLDLKITKTQMADTICVAYESSDESVLTVSDSGYVTAIHTGKATVTAYAAYQDGADDKIKPFIDAKGNYAKSAKLNITVSKVSEVKNIKLEAHGTYAYIDYANVADGYRREVYVLEGANVAADEFEGKISAVKNGNYDAFAAHLFITAADRNVTSVATGKKFWGRIGGLKPNTQYTVYVRNVSALRSFPNGFQIDSTEYYTASKVVKLTTTKSQQERLNGYFKTAAGNSYPVYGSTTVKEDAKSQVYYGYNNRTGEYEYYVDLAAKSVKFDVEAKYLQKDQADIDYADSGDYIWYPLSLTKELQKDYVNPKLTYYVTNRIYDADDWHPDDWKERGMIHAGDYYFYPTSAAAAIDKGGKISLKGDGTVYVFAYDAEQDIISDPVTLQINSSVDGLAGKAIKMKVGNTVSLSDYLTYKQKNIKLSYYSTRDLTVTLEDPDGAFEITPYSVYEGNTRISDYGITAKRPTSKPLTLTVSDKTVKQNGGSDITIQLSASALDPVKNLKAYDVYDTSGRIRFDYSSIADEDNLRFRIEVKDQTGKILENELVNIAETEDDSYWDRFIYKNAEYYAALYHNAYSGIGFREYDAKKNIWTYHYDLSNLVNLTRLSNYTVSVTAVYDGYDAKTVSTRVKTTNIPASTVNAVTYDDGGKDTKNDGGGKVTVYKNNYSTGNVLGDYPLLKSGNTYTLDFTDADKNARNMKTDTLTWSSSNTKAATVKGNAGTFTATLKAVRKGTTQITVTSKITKKIVARWTVFVNAVGEADGYFCDNIYQDTSDADLADKLGADMLTLNHSLTFSLANGEKKWVAFRAPEDGVYSISANDGSFRAFDSDSRPLGDFETSWNYQGMQKGETVYFLLTVTGRLTKQKVTITATCNEQYTSLTTGANGTKVRGGSAIVFTAPEDNVYIITASDKDGKAAGVFIGEGSIVKPIQKGDKVQLRVGGSTAEEYIINVTSAGQMTDGTEIDIRQGETKYYKFTAADANEYTIYTTGATEKLSTEESGTARADYDNGYLELISSADERPSSETDKDPKNIGFDTMHLNKNETIYIVLTAGDKDVKAAFKVEKAAKVGEAFTIAEAGGEKTVVYTADKDGEYRFTASGTGATIDSADINNGDDYVSNSMASCQLTLKKGDYVKLTVTAENANTEITVTCTPVEAVVVKEDAPANDVPVAAGLSRKVEFTARVNGWYAFGFDNNAVRVSYDKTRSSYTSGEEIYLEAGTKLTFTLTTGETTEQKVNVTVTRAEVSRLTSMTDAVTLTKGKTYRYYWIAENEGLYNFDFAVTGAELWSSTEEGSEGSTDADRSGYYGKGQTFYLTLKVQSDADGSFKSVIAKQEAEEMTVNEEKPVTVPAGASKWVSFTSKQAGRARYQYSKADADRFAFIESDGLDSDGREPFSFTEDQVLRPGQKVYYKITNNNDTEKTVKVKIALVVPTEVDADAGTGAVSGTANVKAGTSGWYHFHAANAGRYRISASSKVGETTADVSSYTVYTGLTETTYNDSDTQLMQAGKDIYIKVQNNSADADITVTVTDMAAAATKLELDESGKAQLPLTLKADVPQYLLFSAAQTARYSLTAVDADGNTYTLPVKYYIDRNEDAADRQTPITAVRWTEGSTILFEITVLADVNVTVTLTKETIIDLTDEAAPYDISAGQTLYFRTAIGSKDSRYFVETSVVDGLTLSYNSVSGSMSWSNGYGDFVPYSGQEEMIFGLTASSTFENTKTFNIRRGIAAPASITAGTAAESGELAAYHKAWYSFTPVKAGRYSIKSDGVVEAYRNGIDNSSTGTVSVPGEFVVADTEVNKPVIYALYHTDMAAAKNLSFTIAEVTAEELVQGTPYTVDITKVGAGENVWLHFKAAEDGRYTFTISDTSVAFAMRCYKALNDRSVYKWMDFGTEYCMNAGEEYYIPVSYSTKPAANFTVSVSGITDSSVEAVSVSDTVKELDLKAGEAKWLKFTPEKTANYTLTMTGAQYEGLALYDSISSDVSRPVWNNDYEYALTAGKTVYFKFEASGSLAEGSKPTIKITSEDMQALAEGPNTISEVPSGEYKYAFFAPAEPGIYRLELTDSTDCTVRISTDGYAYNNVLDQNNASSYSLDKEHPVYIKVSSNGDSASAGITITKAASVGTINAGKGNGVSVTLTSDSSMAFYQFKAEEDGVYFFDTDGSGVYVCAVETISDDYLDPYDNDYGSTYGAATELRKGEVRYIKAAKNPNSLSSLGDTFTLTCVKAREESLTGAASTILSLKADEPVLVRWTAGAQGNYEIGLNPNGRGSVTYGYNSFSDVGNLSFGSTWNDTVFSTKYETGSDGKRVILLKAGAAIDKVTVYAQIVPRKLSIGASVPVQFDSSKISEEFDMQINGGQAYIIQTSGASSLVGISMTSDNVQKKPDKTYYIGSDCYQIYKFDSNEGGAYKLRVASRNGASNNSFDVLAYYYADGSTYELNSSSEIETYSQYVQSYEERWYQFNVSEAYYYAFTADSYAYMELYKLKNDNTLESLGTKEAYQYNKIWIALEEGDIVLAQTDYDSHGSGSYSVSVTCSLEQQSESSWSLNSDTTVSMPSYHESVFQLNPDESSDSTVEYTFRLSADEGYSLDDIKMVLYENGNFAEEGQTFTYELDLNQSYELKVKNYSKYPFYGFVVADKHFPYTEYTVDRAGYEKEVTVKDGSEAWFIFEVSEEGTYLFYGIADSYCDNFAELWVNGEIESRAEDGGENGQFSITASLHQNDKVKLRTYMNYHDTSEGTYTVHVEKVPDNYSDMQPADMDHGVIWIPTISSGETVQYRFIAPSVASDDGTSETAQYIFYSEVDNPVEGMKLEASCLLASEVSGQSLGDDLKDSEGNFYNVVELTPGKPYIFSLTNNGNESVTVGKVSACRYAKEQSSDIGGESGKRESGTLTTAAFGETWIPYTVTEDGVYTFTVSNSNNTGYMCLYQVEESHLTQLPTDSTGKESFETSSEGTIGSINLNKDDTVLLRIQNLNYSGKISYSVSVSWETWNITSVESGSNTKTVTVSTDGESKIRLDFDDSIVNGTYEISTTDTSAVLKLYKDGTEVADTSADTEQGETQQGNTVTFKFVSNDKTGYQLGITSTTKDVSLTIQKKTEESEGGGSGSGDNDTSTE